jgi:hypothetical protein
VNPNSPEGRVNADVKSGKLPASFGQYQGNRLPMDLAKEREDAGNAAFDKSVEDDLGIDNASGMNRSDLVRKARDVARGNIETELNSGKQLSANDPEEFDKQYPSISTTDPAGVAKVYADRIAVATKRSADADARLDAANTALRNSAAASKASPAAPAAQTTSTPAASFADTADGVRQSWGTRPSPNIPQDPNNGRNDIYNFNSTPRPRPSNIVDPSADRNLMWNGTIGPNGGQRATPAGSTKSTAQPAGTPAAPAGRERMIAANARADFAEKMLEISTGNTRPVSLGRDAREDNSAKKRIYKQERDEQAAGKAREDQNAFRRSRFALDETMWNGTIGPNGGQRAKPAGSPKPTLKVENTVKPKTPPQTFFPMR